MTAVLAFFALEGVDQAESFVPSAEVSSMTVLPSGGLASFAPPERAGGSARRPLRSIETQVR